MMPSSFHFKIENLLNINALKGIKNQDFKGIFNAVSPAKETNMSFTKTLGKVHKKVVLPIGVPSFVLKLILGELSVILLEGSQVSSKKIEEYYITHTH